MTFQFKVTRVRFVATGLIGGTQQYAPYLGVHGTFPPYALQERVDLHLEAGQKAPPQRDHTLNADHTQFDYDAQVLSYETRGPLRYALQHDEWTRGDEALWIEVYCHTRESGIAELTVKEAAYTERQLTCGLLPLTVQTLLHEHNTTGQRHLSFTRTVVDDLTMRLKMLEYQQEQGVTLTEKNRAQYIDQAMRETAMGEMHIDVEIDAFDQQLYPHTIFAQKNLLTSTLCAVKMPHKSRHAPQLGCRAQKRLDGKQQQQQQLVVVGLDGYHYTPWLYNSEKGVEAMMRAMEHHVWAPYTKHFMRLSESDPAPRLKPLNAHIGQLQMPEWVSKFGRAPVYAYWSAKTVKTREYASEAQRMRDYALYGPDHRTERLLETLLRASIRRYGTSAARFEKALCDHFSPHNTSPELEPYFRLCEEIIIDCGSSAAHSGNYMSDLRFVGERTRRRRARMVINDDWSHPMLNNIANSDDCDGEEVTAAYVIRLYGHGRHTHDFRWESSLLNAVQLYLRHTVIYDVGATVTSAYMDENHKRVTQKPADLPMVDDARDMASECGGHCHSLVEPLQIAHSRLVRGGGVPHDVLDRIAAVAAPLGDAFLKRDTQRHTLVLEPTSSIDAYILPVKEVYATDPVGQRKALAVRQFYKLLSQRQQERRDAEGRPLNGVVDIGGMYTAEGLAYYSERQPDQRRVSSFYNEPVHVLCQELAHFDLALAQMAFCQQVKGHMHYGAKIGDLLRHREKHALVAPFMANREEWKRQVRPLVETLQHQMPFMAFGRYSDEQNALICSHYNLASDVGSRHEKDYTSSQQETLRAQQCRAFEQLAARVSEDPNLAMGRLYARVAQFQQAGDATQALKQFLAQQPGVVDHAYYTVRQLPVCPLNVEILFVVDVNYYDKLVHT